jgi:hypothetical protein
MRDRIIILLFCIYLKFKNIRLQTVGKVGQVFSSIKKRLFYEYDS